jgi:hypothetical protein
MAQPGAAEPAGQRSADPCSSAESFLPGQLTDLSECKIDASGAGQRVLAVLEQRDALINEARGAAPYHDVTAFEVRAAHRIGMAFAAPQEYGW